VILIALGANLPGPSGPPARTLGAALRRLAELGVEIRSVSAFYATPAWPDPSAPPFVNAAALLATRYQPVELLSLLHRVETEFGRKRSAPNASRTLDLDLLDYDGRSLADGIVLPHPRIAERSFVLAPLAEIVPDWRHPLTGHTAAAMLAALPDRDAPRRLP
jgi:2-amino-4-hydroxy-6-hydroxymethyldihydropteridine diphosphokinase